MESDGEPGQQQSKGSYARVGQARLKRQSEALEPVVGQDALLIRGQAKQAVAALDVWISVAVSRRWRFWSASMLGQC
jgi:hypothetical protein